MKAISFSYSNQVLFRISICKSHRDSNNIPAGLEGFFIIIEESNFKLEFELLLLEWGSMKMLIQQFLFNIFKN